MTAHFELGSLLITSNAQSRLDPADVLEAMHRHSIGDWGELDDEDKEENELSLREGCRILSAYTDRNNTKFWIITEADRSATTVVPLAVQSGRSNGIRTAKDEGLEQATNPRIVLRRLRQAPIVSGAPSPQIAPPAHDSRGAGWGWGQIGFVDHTNPLPIPSPDTSRKRPLRAFMSGEVRMALS